MLFHTVMQGTKKFIFHSKTIFQVDLKNFDAQQVITKTQKMLLQ